MVEENQTKARCNLDKAKARMGVEGFEFGRIRGAERDWASEVESAW